MAEILFESVDILVFKYSYEGFVVHVKHLVFDRLNKCMYASDFHMGFSCPCRYIIKGTLCQHDVPG